MLPALIALAIGGIAPPQDYRSDLNFLIDTLRQNGAYVREDHIDLDALKKAYANRFSHVADKREMLGLLEAFVGELHDFHATLGTNNEASPRLVPSGTDVFAHWADHRAFVDQVRPGSVAERGGLRAGDEILSINGKPAKLESEAWLGVRKPDDRAWTWALNSALAGRWNTPRKLTILTKGRSHDLVMATAKEQKSKNVLTVERRGDALLLRPENSLGENELIAAFDAAVPAMRNAKLIVIDLRNTPSGGNTSVARGMMGLFIDHRLPYQRHRVDEWETKTVRDWVEYATPRLQKPIRAKLAILVDHWTGSMGEGIAIGFDALHRATVIGTEMAGLRGAVDRVDLPMSGISVAFPTEQVFHLNGTPRHAWHPPVMVTPGKGDPWWTAARKLQK